MTAPEVFYSYSHKDELLLGELKKHLVALERAQLIRGWFDRMIEPGSQWAADIQAAMERANIILLLISADFVASDYCLKIEVPFALSRIPTGVLVIPVLLRPVEWRDLPFSSLQALPTGAKPVTLWPNQDEAFTDIASHLREVIYSKRLHHDQATIPRLPASINAQRVLDAAVATSVAVDEPAEVVTLIRTVDSAGLARILTVETSFAAKPEDVRSSTFEIDFKVDAAGKALPAAVELTLESPGCEPPVRSKKIRVPPSGDSAVIVFLFTPKRAGRLVLNLELRYDEVETGSAHLATIAVVRTTNAGAPAPYSLTSLPLMTSGFALGSIAVPPAPMELPGRLPPIPGPAGPLVNVGEVLKSVVERPLETLSPEEGPSTHKKSWLTVPVMALSSAAAVILLSGITILNWTGRSSRPTPDSSPVAHPGPDERGDSQAPKPGAAPSPPPPVAVTASLIPAYRQGIAAAEQRNYGAAIEDFSAAIAKDPNNAELYWRRAEAYKAMSRRELAKRDLDRSIALDPTHAYPHILRGEMAQEESDHELAAKEYETAQKAPVISPANKAYVSGRLKDARQKLNSAPR